MLGDAGKRIGPRQRARVRVGHIDLDLADHHEDHRQGDRKPVRHHVLVDLQELMHRLVGDRGPARHVGDEVDRQKQPDHLLDRTKKYPTGAGQQHRCPPPAAVLRGLRRHEPQIVDLLGDLGDQGKTDARREHDRTQVDPLPILTAVCEERADRIRMTHKKVDEGDDHHDKPQRGGPHLQYRERLHPVDHQRNNDDGGHRVSDRQRYAQP
ncbi:Uncharacterised protein [Mycobacteroides abscessus subsp. abscessus]|nr:Uncharacterised protein [Mycobacteroides abscessus subsp. abscessus]